MTGSLGCVATSVDLEAIRALSTRVPAIEQDRRYLQGPRDFRQWVRASTGSPCAVVSSQLG